MSGLKSLILLCLVAFGPTFSAKPRRWSSLPAERLPFEYLSIGRIRIQAVVDSPRVGSTLNSVQQDLGPAEIRLQRYKRDEFASFRFVCYHGGTTDNPFVVLLTSDDEMGGTDLVVQEVSVARADRAPDYAKSCSRLPDLAWMAVTDRGVRLGMQRQAIERLLGAPTEQRATTAVYDVTVKRRNTRHPKSCQPVDVSSSLELVYEQGRVISFKGARDNQC